MLKGLVSILLTSWNRPKMIKEAIDSVLNQTYLNFELWILDDNSKQEVWDVINSYIEKDRDINKIFTTNSCVSDEDRTKESRYAVNINAVIDKIEGEFVTYLTDDDYYMPRRLEVMVDYLNQHPEVSVVYGKQRKRYGDRESNEFRFPNRILTWAPFEVDHCSVMHRASCFEKVKRWRTSNIQCGDADFWADLNNVGYKFYPINEITDVHRYHNWDLSNKIKRGELHKTDLPCE